MTKREQIEEMQIKFSVIDNKTGEYPDLYKIALKEEWAKGLMYCDMEGFSINEDGQLILSDECGKFVYCPSDRFTIVFEDSVVLKIKELEDTCNKCHWVTDYKILKYHEEEVIKLCEQELKQARKETAKEILSYIGNFYDDCDQRFKLKDYQWHKRLCEKYGVEVEE